MTELTRDQAEHLIALARDCRPLGAQRWDTAGLRAALWRIRHWSLAEVIAETITAAADASADKPGVIGRQGRRWAPLAPYVPNMIPREHRCSVCSRSRQQCRQDDHEFVSAATAAKHAVERDADSVTAVVESLRQVVASAEPPAPRTVERDPEADERIEAARAALVAANPGLASPPMRETTQTGGEVGTGAGEGAPRQDTGSAWVTRSADCPEAPAQAHLPATTTTEESHV